jgi:hypothetical protein
MASNVKQVTVVFGVISEIVLGGRTHSLILQQASGEESKTLKGSIQFTEKLLVTDVIKDLTKQLVGDNNFPDNIISKESEEITNLLEDIGKDISLRLNELALVYEDTKKKFNFICRCQLKVSQANKLDIEVHLSYEKSSNNQKTINISLYLKLKDQEFKLNLIKGKNSIFFVASFPTDQKKITVQQEVTLHDLVQCISKELAKDIPENLKIKFNHIFFIYCRDKVDKRPKVKENPQNRNNKPNKTNSQTSGKFLFGLDLDTKINLSELPIVGLPADSTFSLESLKLFFASGNFSEISELQEQNTPSDAISYLKDVPALNAGFALSLKMKLANIEYNLLPENKNSQEVQPSRQPVQKPEQSSLPIKSSASSSIQPKSDNSTLWYDLEKTIGSMRLKRIGLQWVSAEQTILLLIDASLSICNLTVTVDGLAVGYSLKNSEVKYKLRGLGIDYKNSTNTFQIGGAFLWQELTQEEKKIYSFKAAGGLIVKTQTFAIAAIGAYAQFKSGDCSLLIYAVLDKTLGGYPGFLVTGLALGFGYNRAFKKPELDNLKEFPLVKLAIAEDAEDKKAGDLLTGLGTLDTYLPPQKGSLFLAIGVKFTTYKLINSFILLVASLSDKWEFHILGISTFMAPPSVEGKSVIDPIAKIELGFTATFSPNEGTLKVLGKILPGSYILSPEAKLSGGFAFYAWFTGEHKGDFVLTIGGYHPDFKVPAHYPQVERVGFNLANIKGINFSIKGSTYLALTPSAIMAGGSWEATYHSDRLKASFKADVSFLVAWQPFHYDVNINFNVHAEHNFTGIGGWATHDVGASLHIWGPEFSGEVKIDLGVTSETFTFGKASKSTPTISWDDFKRSFLPADKKVCNINIKSGLIRTLEKDSTKLGIVNPQEFSLVVESAIPFKTFKTTNSPQKNSPQNKEDIKPLFGIAPMDIKADQFESSLEVIIVKKGSEDKIKDVDFELIHKNIPVGMWGESKETSLNRENFIKDAKVGFEIKTKKIQTQDNKPVELEDRDRNNIIPAKAKFIWEKFSQESPAKPEKKLLCEFLGLVEQEIKMPESLEIYRDNFQ